MKHVACLFMLVLLSITGHSQDSLSQKHVKHRISIGAVQSSFQDIKYSNVRNNGIGSTLGYNYRKDQPNRIIEYSIDYRGLNENPATYEVNVLEWGSSNVKNAIISMDYRRVLKNNLNMGFRVDLIDFYLRNTVGAGNNSTYYTNSSSLYYSLEKTKSINPSWDLKLHLDLGLLNLFKESTSFAFSAQQSALENGEFNYQNTTLQSPFGYKYFNLNPIWKQLNINVALELVSSKRWTFSYQWKMRTFSTVPKYRTTVAHHSLGMGYRFIHKTKRSQSQPQIQK